MKVIRFIMLYQFFDAQEIKLKNRLIALEKIPFDFLNVDDLREIEYLRLKIDFLKDIYKNLIEFVIDE